jgi:hypothetical protein
LVVVGDAGLDGLLQFCDAAEDSAPDALGGDPGEKALYLIEPTGMGWDKVQLPARVFAQPTLDSLGLVRGVVLSSTA